MNATQKKAWKMKLSEAAKLRWERKRKNLKKKAKGKKEGTWKAERTETNGIKFRYHKPSISEHEAAWEQIILTKPNHLDHGEQPIEIEDIRQIKEMVSKIGKDAFLRLVEVVG